MAAQAVPAVVHAVDHCPRLEAQAPELTALRLELSSYAKAEESLAALRSSLHLKELALKSGSEDEEVGRVVREVLLKNRSLERLTLDLKECSDKGAEHLAELMRETSNIKYLTLMLNNVTEAGAKKLAEALPESSLLSLTLYASQLDLHDRVVGDEGVGYIAEALQRSPHITALTIAQNGVTNTGLGPLLQAMGEKSGLSSLNLHSNHVDAEGAAMLARHLSSSSSSALKQLILNENHSIGDGGARELALALCHNSSLEALSLKSCGIGKVGGQRFATPLSQNTSLRVLNLCGNVAVGDGGVEMIARGLRCNSVLRQLDLSSCGITDEGCDHLAGALSDNCCLTHLLLMKNAISNGGAEALGKALTLNSSLLALDLSDNPVGEKGVAALGQALEHNTTLTMLVLGQAVTAGHASPFPSSFTRPRKLNSKDEATAQLTPETGRARTAAKRDMRLLAAQKTHHQGGGGHGSTAGLVEVLLIKNRKLATYRRRVRELKDQVRALEEELAQIRNTQGHT